VSGDDAIAYLGARAGEPAAAWLRAALDEIANAGAAGDAFARAWGAAGRRLGRLELQAGGQHGPPLSLPAAGFCADEYGRALLLRAALARTPADAHAPLVENLYATGELREQQAVLRALPHLAGPARHLGVAVEAVRHNATSVIAAIACDNPFPAQHFLEAAFNQMVVKCLFVGLPLDRVVGLPGRIGPELRRMVADYARERRAAGRPVPADAALVLEGVDPHAPV